jgi:predicted nucleic-acid-binding protein
VIAVDTNVVVRLLTRDDEAQFHAAHTLFQGEDIFISKTVVLEVEWVLRFAYEFAAGEIVAALRRLFGLENVTLEYPLHVATALEWHGQGLDFADALHLSASQEADRFVTFDHSLVRRAATLSAITVASP